MSDKNNCHVYIHTNKVNGKRYIGITSNKPNARWNNGNGYKHNPHFTNAIKKYGWDNFSHEILASGLDEESAKEMEKTLIKQYNSTNPLFGYNQSSGGEPMSGVKHSEQTKQKMSESAKGRKASEETRRKISEALKHRDAELVYKFAHSRKGKSSWCKGLKGELHYNYGKKYSEERKRNISLGRTQHQIKNLKTGRIYRTVLDACADTNVSKQAIYAHCNHVVKHPEWEYIKEA